MSWEYCGGHGPDKSAVEKSSYRGCWLSALFGRVSYDPIARAL